MKYLLLLMAIIFVNQSSFTQQQLEIGTKAPHFSAITFKNNPFNLEETLKGKPVVLLFYRGQWCPYCNKQMSELQDSIQLIYDLGATVIAITPEKPDEIKRTIEKTQANFPIIYDKNHQIMDLYHVTFLLSKAKNALYKGWGIDINEASGNNDNALPVPATYIIGKDGKIKDAFFDENYKNRMSVKDILKALKN